MEIGISSDIKIISIKIALLGESGVGKTSILQRYCYDKFTIDNEITKIASFAKSVICSSDKKTEVHLKIWDTAGQETYRSLASFYCKDADVVFLVYDLTNKKSFDALSFWLDKVHANSSSECIIVLLGNKCDCIEKEAVDKKTLDRFTNANNLESFIVSAKDNINIKKAFESIVIKKYPQFASELGYEIPVTNANKSSLGKNSVARNKYRGNKLTKANNQEKSKGCC